MTPVTPEDALKAGSALGSSWMTDFTDLSRGDFELHLAAIGEMGFNTSGTSGQPSTWMRTSHQLLQEAEMTAHVLGLDHDSVHSTVSSESLYGFAAVLVAAKLQIPYVYDCWGVRQVPIRGKQPLVFSIPPSWQTLPDSLTRFFDEDRSSETSSVRVIHAGARLPPVAYQTVLRLKRHGHHIDGVELFGASETGVLGSRQFSVVRDAPWTVVSDTTVVSNDQSAIHGHDGRDAIHLLTIGGPRVGHIEGSATTTGGTATTGDLVVDSPTGTLRIIGRASRRVKPGGRWVDLDRLDSQLLGLLPEVKFVTTPIDDPLWGEHIELIIDPSCSIDADSVHLHLRRHSDLIDVVPIRVRADASLDRSPMGKIRLPKPAHSRPGQHAAA